MPRGLAADAAEAVRGFVDAFNAEDLDALVAVLDPHVEIQARRGLVLGHDEVRRWATRNPDGHLHQHLMLDGVRTDGHPAVALLRRRWGWKEGSGVADETEFAALVTMRDGKIARWQPFEDRGDALRAAQLDA